MKAETVFAIIFVAVLISSCTNKLSDPTPKSQPVTVATLALPATWTPRPSLTFYPTATKAPSFTPIPSSTQYPTWTQTPNITDTPTSTPWPSQYARNRLLNLYSTNGYCRLPCWWGITPGETTYNEMKLLFAPYAETIELEEYLPDFVFFYYPSPNPSIDYFISSSLNLDENGTIKSIALDPETVLYNGFSPSYLLSNYGKPDQILISSSELYLIYADQHFLALFDIFEKKDTHQICFSTPANLILWSSADTQFLTNIQKSVGNMSILPWAEVTKLDAQVLYKALKTWGGTEKEYCFSIRE
jgi:hypothetical protein